MNFLPLSLSLSHTPFYLCSQIIKQDQIQFEQPDYWRQQPIHVTRTRAL